MFVGVVLDLVARIIHNFPYLAMYDYPYISFVVPMGTPTDVVKIRHPTLPVVELTWMGHKPNMNLREASYSKGL